MFYNSCIKTIVLQRGISETQPLHNSVSKSESSFDSHILLNFDIYIYICFATIIVIPFNLW